MIIAETFDHGGQYRGAHILPCAEITAGFTASHGVLNQDITALVKRAYEAGCDKAAADVREMNQKLTADTLGAQRKIAELETLVRAIRRGAAS